MSVKISILKKNAQLSIKNKLKPFVLILNTATLAFILIYPTVGLSGLTDDEEHHSPEEFEYIDLPSIHNITFDFATLPQILETLDQFRQAIFKNKDKQNKLDELHAIYLKDYSRSQIIYRYASTKITPEIYSEKLMNSLTDFLFNYLNLESMQKITPDSSSTSSLQLGAELAMSKLIEYNQALKKAPMIINDNCKTPKQPPLARLYQYITSRKIKGLQENLKECFDNLAFTIIKDTTTSASRVSFKIQSLIQAIPSSIITTNINSTENNDTDSSTSHDETQKQLHPSMPMDTPIRSLSYLITGINNFINSIWYPTITKFIVLSITQEKSTKFAFSVDKENPTSEIELLAISWLDQMLLNSNITNSDDFTNIKIPMTYTITETVSSPSDKTNSKELQINLEKTIPPSTSLLIKTAVYDETIAKEPKITLKELHNDQPIHDFLNQSFWWPITLKESSKTQLHHMQHLASQVHKLILACFISKFFNPDNYTITVFPIATSLNIERPNLDQVSKPENITNVKLNQKYHINIRKLQKDKTKTQNIETTVPDEIQTQCDVMLSIDIRRPAVKLIIPIQRDDIKNINVTISTDPIQKT